MSNLIPMPKETLNRCRNMALNLLLELDETPTDKFTLKIQAFYNNSSETAKIVKVQLYVQTYSLYHDLYQDEHGEWHTEHDTVYKEYCFPQDFEWRFPIPDPSIYEIYPVVNFTDAGDTPIVVQNCNLDIYSTALTITLNNPENIVEIRNLPCGIYSLNVYPSEQMENLQYYPDYYNNYPSSHYIQRGNVQIDRNGNVSGFSKKDLYNTESPYQPIGYDFYCITDKFTNNIVPVVGTRRPLMKYVFCWLDVPGITNIPFSLSDSSGIYQSVTCQKIRGIKIYADNSLVGICSLDYFQMQNSSDGVILTPTAIFSQYIDDRYSIHTRIIKENVFSALVHRSNDKYDYTLTVITTNINTSSGTQSQTTETSTRTNVSLETTVQNAVSPYNEKWTQTIPQDTNTHKYYYTSDVVVLDSYDELGSIWQYVVRSRLYPNSLIEFQFDY